MLGVGSKLAVRALTQYFTAAFPHGTTEAESELPGATAIIVISCFPYLCDSKEFEGLQGKTVDPGE